MSSEKPATFSGYSPAESKLIQIAFKHMRGVPDCDWDAIASEYGYKDDRVARAKYGLAMNKYKNTGATSNGAAAPGQAAKVSPRKRKAEAAPNGKARRGRKPKGLSAVEVQENEDDVEETEEKVKVEPKEEATSHDDSDTEPVAKEEEEKV
ncbi:hypothetical protein MMC17_005836 [Xylographa soralifera]|nr:hypothetical protein [Xylographa soralifera]